MKQENIISSSTLELAGLFHMAFKKQRKCYLLWDDFLALTSTTVRWPQSVCHHT